MLASWWVVIGVGLFRGSRAGSGSRIASGGLAHGVTGIGWAGLVFMCVSLV